MSENELKTPGGKLRLRVEASLGVGLLVAPHEQQVHYLLHVMRAKNGDLVSLFNGRDGEWLARIVDVSKRTCSLQCDRKIAEQNAVPDLWLCFAPIKKIPADYVVQKATELGVRKLQPVFTRRTIVNRVNLDRIRANAVEAAEQCGRMCIPQINEALDFDQLLSRWPVDRRLVYCDERGDARPIAQALAAEIEQPFALIIGPEGGFDPVERAALRSRSFVVPVSLGSRVLRADTAALAALAIWQSVRGDWR